MNAETFVANWKAEKDAFLASLLDGKTLASRQILELGLPREKTHQLQAAVDTLLTDVFYTLLLGLDGSASIGGVQETFKIYDDKGKLVSDGGDLEAEAYEQFHAK